jgi:transketolase
MTFPPQALLAETDPRRQAAMTSALARRIRLEMLDILHRKGTGHWGGAASACELLTALYFLRMKVDPARPRDPDRDRLVLSKGHASLLLYAVLAHRGFFSPELLGTFRDADSNLQGHPCMRKTPGVDMSTGALGHGLSVGLGMALAAQLAGKRFWTYVVVGEGCLDEGQTWEAAMAAAKFRPERLALLVDHNKVQLDGPSDLIMPLGSIARKLDAFGWNVAPGAHDGHDPAAIMETFRWLDGPGPWPRAVIYDTVKGKGVSFMEGQSKWHGAPVDDAGWAQARPELTAALAEAEALL